MAVLTEQVIVRAGIAVGETAAAALGDSFANNGSQFILVINGSGASINVTIVTQATADGLAVADRVVAVGAGASKLIGPFPAAIYNNTAGKVELTYSAVTDVTVGVFRVS